MNVPVLVLHLLNFLLIVVTPKIFFRRDGTFNIRWWLTAAPFGLTPLVLVAAEMTGLPPMRPAGWATGSAVVSVCLAVASFSLLFFTLGTHRVPIALWHQGNDAPRHIVTGGAYRRIRHPFYTSYLLATAGAVVFFPHWSTAGLLVYTACTLNATAAREERRLIGSEFGAEYARYAAGTGRFLPRWRAPGTAIREAAT